MNDNKIPPTQESADKTLKKIDYLNRIAIAAITASELLNANNITINVRDSNSATLFILFILAILNDEPESSLNDRLNTLRSTEIRLFEAYLFKKRKDGTKC